MQGHAFAECVAFSCPFAGLEAGKLARAAISRPIHADAYSVCRAELG